MSNSLKYILGLDIGASSIKYGWGDCQQGLQHYAKKELSLKSLSFLKETVHSILRECDSMCGLDNILAIGIGTPGTIDTQSGKIAGTNPNLPFWSGHSPAELIPSELNIPVYYDNDANLMCLAEAWQRKLSGKVIGITVGSGIGSGMVDAGKVYRGAHGYAMELGHVIATPGGAICTCGRKGCLEAYASVDGLRRRIEALPGFSHLSGKNISLIEMLKLREQYPEVDSLVQEGRFQLARALSDLIVVLDPDVIVVGGGAMDAGLYSLEVLTKDIYEMLPLVNLPHLRLDMALEGNRAGTMGAVILASSCDFSTWE